MRADSWRHIAICLCALVGVTLGGRADMPMLRWLGDEKARGNLTNVAMKILREDKALSYAQRGGETPPPQCLANKRGGAVSAALKERENSFDNILVYGDNLEALKALLPFLAGKVKCIYIDPP